MTLLGWTMIAMVVLAAGIDVGTRKIPNVLTVAGLVIALGLRGLAGWDPLVAGLAGAGLGFVVSAPLFFLGGMGGGDVKLLTAVGAFLGPKQLFIAFLATALVGGLMAVVVAARKGVLLNTLHSALQLLAAPFNRSGKGEGDKIPNLATPGAISVPYGLAIAFGAVTGLLL